MARTIRAEPLTQGAFKPFGDVIDTSGDFDKLINQGLCERFHDRAQLDFGHEGRAGISLFQAQPRSLPYSLDLLERHPEGSQAFIPMTENPFLVIVADNGDGKPGEIHAFITEPGQAINLLRDTWHGVLTPLASPGLFAVIDRIGPGANLVEYPLDDPVIIEGTT